MSSHATTLLRSLFSFLAAPAVGGAASPVVLRGTASYYDDALAGKAMSNGQPYNPRAFTLACNDLPLGTLVYLTHLNDKGWVRHAHATVADRGPAEHLRAKGRIFDLSRALFTQLADPKMGFIYVSVQVVP